MRKLSQKKKKTITRVILLIMVVVLILGFIILPLSINTYAAETDVVVSSFETGSLASAIETAKDGTDLNQITSIAVLSGELDGTDFQALCGYPNVEYIELAGCTVKDGIIPKNALSSRNQLSYISLPQNTVEIGARAFSNNKKLVKISVPTTLRIIDEYAFESCELLESISLPASLESIGEGAFKDCKAITSLSLPEAITEVPAYCFQKCGISELHLGPQVTKIGDGAFSDCYNLTDIYYYGKTPLDMNEGCFQNAKLTLHIYEDCEGFESLNSNFVTVAYDMDTSSEYIPPADSADTVETAVEEDTDNEDVTSAEEDTAETDSSAVEEYVTTADETQTAVQESADTSSTTFSALSVVIIVVLAAALAVAVTLLVVNKRK